MPKTMATKITEENYPIAVACLAAGFATIPINKVLGCYLVINELIAENMEGEGIRPYLVVGNFWMKETLFNEIYEFAAPGTEDRFVEVRKIK